MILLLFICSQLIVSVFASNTSFTQLTYDQSNQCIDRVQTVGTSKILIVPQYIETRTFPEKLRIYHEFPIKTENGEVFGEKGSVKYTVELKGNKGLQLTKAIQNVSFLIDDFSGITLPRQNPNLRWIVVGDLAVPRTCQPTLTVTGFISKSCGKEENVRVARSAFRGKLRVVSNWISLHLSSVKITKTGALVKITDWGKLVALPMSPCREHTMSVWVATHFHNQHNTRVGGPQSVKKEVKLRDLPESLDFTLQNYPTGFYCYNLIVTLNIKTDFEYQASEHIIGGQPSPGQFHAISEVKCHLDITEDVTVHIASVAGKAECLSQLLVFSQDKEKLLSQNLTVARSYQISASMIQFCKHPVFSVVFNDKENQIIRSETQVKLLDLVLDNEKLFVKPVNDKILKDCGNIFRLTIFCKTDPNAETVFSMTRYLYLYQDFLEQFREEIENKYCSLSGETDSKWIYIDRNGAYEYVEEDYIDIKPIENTDDCKKAVSMLSIGFGLVCVFSILLITGILFFWWRSRRVTENLVTTKDVSDAEVINKIQLKEHKPENIYSSLNNQPPFNPGFVEEKVGGCRMIERSVSCNQDSQEASMVCLRKRGSGSINYSFDFHDGD